MSSPTKLRQQSIRSILRSVWNWRWVRWSAYIVLGVAILAACSILLFKTVCASVATVPGTVARTTSPVLYGEMTGIPDYNRPEESTYLTFAEWYTVFSYQEYATHVTTQSPSSFPYARAIGQFWVSYCNGYEATRHDYPFNSDNHLMLAVVGLSFSTEYAIKGAYENTVGRITEIDSYTTPQDRVNTDLSIAYGAFIPDEPWYAFPFHSWLGDVWRTPVFGDSPLRRFERKGFLVTENAIKTGYASVIKKATGAVYGAPDPVVYLTASNVPRDVTSLDPRISVIKQLDNGRTVLSVPHYQGFTETIPLLARAGVTFHDFAGNDEIAITAVIPRDLGIPAFAGRELYRMPVLIDAERERIAILVDVPDLGTAFTFYDENDVFVEHLYDY